MNDQDGNSPAAITLGIGDEEFRLSGFPDWFDEIQIVKVISGVRCRTAGTVVDDVESPAGFTSAAQEIDRSQSTCRQSKKTIKAMKQKDETPAIQSLSKHRSAHQGSSEYQRISAYQ